MAAVCLIGASALWQIAREASVSIPARYDYDEGVYAATADALVHGGRLYKDVFLSQPPVMILMMRGMFALLGTSLAAARLTSVMMSAVWLVAILAILRARGFPWGGPLAVCVLLGSAAFLIKAHTVEMEVASEALACTAVAFAAWRAGRPGSGWWAAAGALAALAVMTKLTAATCVIPLAGAALIDRRPALAWRWAMLAAVGLLVVGALVPLIGTAGFWDQVFAFHIAVARVRPQSPIEHAATVAQFLASEWPLTAAAAVGLWWSIRNGGRLERALVVWLAADCAVLVALTPLWEHHLFILISPLALLAGTALDRTVSQVARLPLPRITGAVLAVAVMVYVALGASDVPPAAAAGDLTRLVNRIAPAVPPDGKILTDDPMVAFLARRPLAGGLIDTSLTRIWAGEITEVNLGRAMREADTGAVVLWRGTFREYFPRLEPAAASLFPIAVKVRGGRVLYLKRQAAFHGHRSGGERMEGFREPRVNRPH